MIAASISSQIITTPFYPYTKDIHGLDKFDTKNYKVVTYAEDEVLKGLKFKRAYGREYPIDEPDWEIELDQIKRTEQVTYKRKLGSGNLLDGRYITEQEGILKLAEHYKQIIRLWFPQLAKGWNTWSEDILYLCLRGQLNKVLWGSGNCGKSAIIAAFLYIKYRVNPGGRLILILSRFAKDSKARVYGYIKGYHAIAPASKYFDIEVVDTAGAQEIRTLTWDDKQKHGKGAWVKDELTGIVNMPIRVDLKSATSGANLVGRHPTDWYGIAFDEGHQLLGTMMDEEFFTNILTNDNVDFYAWGNPTKVFYHDPSSWDMLFRMGNCGKELHELRAICAKGSLLKAKTLWWEDGRKTAVLRFTMLNSPKDHPLERENIIHSSQGQVLRLHFLAGLSNVEGISEGRDEDSPEFYGQVYGFPYIEAASTGDEGVLTPFQVSQCNKYPFMWAAPQLAERKFCLGVDPSLTGYGDGCAISIIEIGRMLDGRWGIDGRGSEGVEIVKPLAGYDFIDLCLARMWDLSQKYKIPLHRIGFDLTNVGYTFQYALNNAINTKGWWKRDYSSGSRPYTSLASSTASELPLFMDGKGSFEPANELCVNPTAEDWLSMRCGVISRQIFNIPEEVLKQAYNRKITGKGLGGDSNARVKLESKDKMRARGLKSPDHTDAFTVALGVARRNGFVYQFTQNIFREERLSQAYWEAQQEEKLQGALSSMLDMLGAGGMVGGSGRRKTSRGGLI